MSGQLHKLALPKGTVLQQYQIESVLGVGGFGLVYKAKHIELEKSVAIKEYLPQHCATRAGTNVSPLSSSDELAFEEGIEKFLEEAKQLIKFDDHPNIIRCTDFFRENGTAYLVMKLEVGNELSEILNRHTVSKNPLSEQQIVNIITPVLEGLKFIHSEGVLHRDIKPANIFMRKKDAVPLLIDFGAAKQDFSNSDKTEHQMHTKGYAPTEQVAAVGDLGPWTDIHAVGAMMWRIIANTNPPESAIRQYKVSRGEKDPLIARLETLTDQYSLPFLNAIAKATALRHEDRFQDADSFIQALNVGMDNDQTVIGDSGEVYDDVTEVYNPNELDSGATIINSGSSSNGKPSLSGSPGVTEGPEQANSNNQSRQSGSNVSKPTTNSPRKFSTKLMLISLAGVTIVGVSAFIYTGNEAEGQIESSSFSQFEFEKDVESVYRLIDESERFSDDNGNKIILALNLCKSGSLDNMTKKMISDSKASINRKQASIEENLINARRKSYSLVTQYQKDNESMEQFMDEVVSTAKNNGNYNKSELLSDYFRNIKAASQLLTESEIKEYLKEKIAVDLHDTEMVCDASD